MSIGVSEAAEGLNIPPCTLSEFFDDIEGRLAFLTGKIDYEQFGLTLEDVRKPILVVGKPGIGKTCGIISCIKEMNKTLPKDRQLGFKKILLGQTVVGAMQGIPAVGKDGKVVRVQMPDLPDPVRDGEYGVLFLDEITTADEMQIQPALGLCDDSRCLGEYTLPEHWLVVAAGNGPDCTNFVRMDDMTLSRFSAYDVSYNYKTDFRPYAHKVGINEDIIAFLNAYPDMCVHTESTDMDNAGKQFPSPRTWERLSTELRMREARGKPVGRDQMSMTHFAGRIIGFNAANKFGALTQIHKNMTYSIEKILDGTERPPEVGMSTELYHIILQSLFKNVREEIRAAGGSDTNVDTVPRSMYDRVGNMLTWILKFDNLEMKVASIIEIRQELHEVAMLVFDEDFCNECCPDLDKFYDENAAVLQQHMNDLAGLKF